MLTSKGYLGPAASSTKSGDHIFMLLGHWMPIVLSHRLDDT